VPNQVIYRLANSDQDLKQILELQHDNLLLSISIAEAKDQGFVTCQHDLDLLRNMNAKYQHVIASMGNQVVAYALVMLPELRDSIDVLVPMFERIDRISYQGVSLRTSKYFVMGQVCVSKPFRGQGVFTGLYNKMKTVMREAGFKYLITEISTRNTRSIKAHQKEGFVTIDSYTSTTDDWHIVIVAL